MEVEQRSMIKVLVEEGMVATSFNNTEESFLKLLP
jgi:hypothetical protein